MADSSIGKHTDFFTYEGQHEFDFDRVNSGSSRSKRGSGRTACGDPERKSVRERQRRKARREKERMKYDFSG